MEKTKLFVANITLRHGEYETQVKRLILAKSYDEAIEYAHSNEGMPVFDGSCIEDGNSYKEDDQENTWYFCGGDWCVTLGVIWEMEDREMAKAVIASGLVSFL